MEIYEALCNAVLVSLAFVVVLGAIGGILKYWLSW